MIEQETPPKETIVSLFKHPDGFCQLLVRPCGDEVTYLISFDKKTGTPLFMGIPHEDVFPTYDVAMLQIALTKSQPIIAKGCGLLGIAKSGNTAVLGIVTKAEQTAKLPTGDIINTIRDIKYIRIPFESDPTPLEKFQLVNNHIYCETFDISRPFPSKESVSKPDNNFVWNAKWIQPFVHLGLQRCCIILVQGAALTYTNSTPGDLFSVTYMIRRSNSNPGTNYATRGLNDLNFPCNEVEADLVLGDHNGYSSAQWLRGSVPIRWKTTFSSIGSPRHQSAVNFMEGTEEYFRRLNEKYGNIPIFCISMLDDKEGSAEYEVSQAFISAISNVYAQGVTNVQLFTLNLNETFQEYNPIESYRGFLLSKGILGSNSFGMNEFDYQGNCTRTQRGILRFSCGDSLDKTNIGTFFYAMKMTGEWCLKTRHGLNNIDTRGKIPIEILTKPLLEFLENAFSTAGNAISRLYANSDCVRIRHIGLTSPSKGDATVAVKRRFENIFGDEQRDEVIKQWLSPNTKLGAYTLNKQHLFLLNPGRTITEEIIRSRDPFYTTGSIDLAMPTVALLDGISFVLHPLINKDPVQLEVYGGMDMSHLFLFGKFLLPKMDEPISICYQMNESFLWGSDDVYNDPIRVVRLQFDGPCVIVQNISLEIDMDLERKRSPTFHNNDKDDIQIFQDVIDECLRAPQLNNANLMELERKRISLRLPSVYKRDRIGGNPWTIDSAAQFIASKSNHCCFCRQFCLRPFTGFYQASILRGLVTIKATNNPLSTCNQCRIAYRTLINPTPDLEERLVPQFYHRKQRQPIQSYQTDSLYALSLVINNDEYNSLFEDTPTPIQFCGCCEMDVFFYASCFISHIAIESDTKNIQVSINDMKLQYNPDKGAFMTDDSLNSYLLKRFTLRIESSKCTLSRIRMYGRIIKVPIPIIQQTFEPTPRLMCNMIHSKGEFNADNRCIDFHISDVVEVCGIQTVSPDSPINPISLEIHFFANGIYLSDKTVSILIPKMKPNAQTQFFFSPIQTDNVRICFLDRLPQIKPMKYKLIHDTYLES